MKKFKRLQTAFVFLFFLNINCLIGQQNQSFGNLSQPIINPLTTGSGGALNVITPTGITNVEGFRFRPGLITGIENPLPASLTTANALRFTADNQWWSLGRVNVASGTQYGLRFQRAGRALLFGYDGSLQGTSATPTLADPIIQWGGNSGISVTPGDLLFRNFTSPTSASPDQVLRLKSNGKMVPGKLELASNFLAEIDASNNASISGGMLIDVKNITLSTSPVGLLISVSGTSGASGIIANANGGSATGVQGNASGTGAGTVIGLLGIANGGSGIRYGVYGSSSGSGFAGFFAGNVFATGTITSSDEKLKITITEETGLQKLMQLKPVSFYYNKAAIADLKMPESFQHGFIAQDMEKVFPESVMEVNAPIFKTNIKTGEQIVERIETFKGINYTALIAVLTKSIQEQQQMILALKNEMAALKSTQQLAKAINSGYTLSQNVPNPFSGNTIINYTLPASTERAILLVTDLNGKMQQQYNLARGSNQQTISGTSLAAGIYLYSLVVNGQEVVSKRMVVAK